MIKLPIPQQQIDFSFALLQARAIYLQEALGQTVGTLELPELDRQLAAHAPQKQLSALAKKGLRGELVFAVPMVLRANPYLLAYYRLLSGYSQKEFYASTTGASRFKSCEAEGRLAVSADPMIGELCEALNISMVHLLGGIGFERITTTLLDDLTLLTLGPQLRGGANVRRGDAAIVRVFELIHGIVKKTVKEFDAKTILIRNAARRTVRIEFSADPDIIIREEMVQDAHRNVIAIEIKGGTDYSNIHNRIGEAEKSHRKARDAGYTECWTVVNVDKLELGMARRESPSTDRFYRLNELEKSTSAEFKDFKNRIISLTGIRG